MNPCACGCGQTTTGARFLSGHTRRAAAKLTPEIAKEIRSRAAAGERQCDLATAFGVTRPTIAAVVQARIYSDKPRPPRMTEPRLRAADRVLEVLRSRSGAVARQELTEILGLYKATVSNALQDLRRRGLVERVGRGQETRYQLIRPAAALSMPRGDRPRRLGLRAAWLRQQGAQPETMESEESA